MVGETDKSILAHVSVDSGADTKSLVLSQALPARATIPALQPYVIFSVTPAMGSSYDFIDMFISSGYKPHQVVISLTPDFGTTGTIAAAAIQQYVSGLWFVRLPRLSSGTALIGKTLYVKILFPSDNLYTYDIKWVKTGYKDVIGG